MRSRPSAFAIPAWCLLSGALAVDSAHAQTAQIEMAADPTQVAVGDVFTLQINIQIQGGQVDTETLPSLDAFRIVGRQVSRPIQFTFGFGSQTQMIQSSTVHTFNLQALNAGTFRIDAPKVRVGRQVFVGNPVTIRVVETTGTNLTGSPIPSDKPPPAENVAGNEFDPNLFVRTVVDKPNPYVGEQVTVTVYLYDRGVLSESPTPTREPTTEGFWVQDLLPPSRPRESTVDVVNGTRFRVYVFRRFAAFPLRAGALTIGPMAIESATSPFDRFFGANAAPLARASNPVTIDVKPLPQGTPDTASVGQFTLESSLDASRVTTGNAAVLTVVAQGSGTLHELRFEQPEIPGLRIHPPEIKDEVTMPGDLVSGTRRFEWMIVPEQPGTYTLPALTMNTFDPTTGEARTLRTSPLTLVATGAATAPVPDAALPATRESADDAPDLTYRPIRTRSELSKSGGSIARAPYFPWLIAAPPAFYLTARLGSALRRRARRRSELGASSLAVRRAKKRFANAERLCSESNARAFYAELTQILGTILDVRTGAASGGMTRPELREALASRGASSDLIEDLVEELDNADFARFATAGASREEMQRALERARNLFERIDSLAVPPAGGKT